MDGIINVYKEKGYTSHDVVARMRGILRMKKVGHTGTLDPDAEGVLPICMGKGTKLSGMLTDGIKTYRTVMLLGRETDTQDASGVTVADLPVRASEQEVRETILGFLGVSLQIPPMYSARKVNGKKLYDLARAGRTVEREARPVEILEIRVDEMRLPRVTMTVSCTKGTYIRTLCHDIGQKLGCGACMEQLLRIRSGRFCVEDSLKLGEIEELRDLGKLDSHVLGLDEIFSDLPVFAAAEKSLGDKLMHNGNPIPLSCLRAVSGSTGENPPGNGDDGRVRVYDSEGQFIGIYRYDPAKGQFRPYKIF